VETALLSAARGWINAAAAKNRAAHVLDFPGRRLRIERGARKRGGERDPWGLGQRQKDKRGGGGRGGGESVWTISSFLHFYLGV